MQNWETSKFDESWKDAFEGAEVSPSELVWSGVDQKLTQAEGDSMKRRVVIYQRLAAACILFALTAGSFGIYYWNVNSKQLVEKNSAGNSTNELAAKKTLTPQDELTNKVASVDEKRPVKKSNGASIDKINRGQDILKKPDLASEEKSGNSKEKKSAYERDSKEDFLTSQQIITLTQEASDSTSSIEKLNSTRSMYATNLDLPRPELLPVMAVDGEPTYVEIMRKLPALPAVFMNDYKKEDFSHEKLWASVSAATGSYTALNSGLSYAVSPSANVASSYNSSNPVGKSYSYGVIGGVRVAPRWVLQTGVQYMNQSAPFVSNINTNTLGSVSAAAYSPALYSGSISSPYSIMSTNEFVSVPVQLGYLLINRKVGWQINPGVATDFFMRNTLSDPNGQKQSYSQSAGADSPYRSVNFAGLMSSEVSYKLSKNYRVSLVPGFRYSFSPALKSQTIGNPLAWDIGFRFRYILR